MNCNTHLNITATPPLQTSVIEYFATDLSCWNDKPKLNFAQSSCIHNVYLVSQNREKSYISLFWGQTLLSHIIYLYQLNIISNKLFDAISFLPSRNDDNYINKTKCKNKYNLPNKNLLKCSFIFKSSRFLCPVPTHILGILKILWKHFFNSRKNIYYISFLTTKGNILVFFWVSLLCAFHELCLYHAHQIHRSIKWGYFLFSPNLPKCPKWSLTYLLADSVSNAM